MSLFCYCYNISFVLLFTAALSACFMTYGATGKIIFRYFGELMFAYICESIYISVVGIATVFDFTFSQFAFEWIYFFFLDILAAAEVYILGKIIYAMFGRRDRRPLYALSLLVAVITAPCSVAPGQLRQFLLLSIFSAMLLVFCGLYQRLAKRETDADIAEDALKYSGIMKSMGVFSALAILENVVYIFFAQDFVNTFLPFYGNQIKFFEDIFCIIFSVWLLRFTSKEREKYTAQKIERILQHRMNEFQARQQEQSKKVGKEQLVEFCKYYNLTEREAEILRLILDGKSNQELSEELFITIGTVKAHVHSIFGKLEVSRRSQLMTRFVNHGVQ